MDQAIERFNKEIEFVKQVKQQKRISNEISEKKDEYLLRQEEKERKKAEDELKIQQELKKKEEERANRAIKSKTTANVYKNNKQYMAELEKNKLRQEQIEKQRKNQERVKNNKDKVIERQAVQEQKILDRLDEQEYKLQQKEEDQYRINKAISQYSHIPKVEIDSERVKQATKSKIAKKVQFDKSDKINLFPQTGFTADNLMKDMRYRLSSMLNEAGLHNSEYGKRILQAAPHIQPRKDTIASHNFK